MKKLLLIVAIIVIAVPAHAQLFMAWNACDGTAGSSTENMNLDCEPGSGFTAELWGTFGLPDGPVVQSTAPSTWSSSSLRMSLPSGTSSWVAATAPASA